MNEAIRFLHALAHALATMGLYSPGHPAAERALDAAAQALAALLESAPTATFMLLGGAPIYQGRALHELEAWPWSARLAAAGVQRLEIDRQASGASLAELLRQIDRRMTAEPDLAQSGGPIDGIRYGVVEVRAGSDAAGTGDADAPSSRDVAAEQLLAADDEMAAVEYIHAEARADRLAGSEIDVVIRLLAAQVDRLGVPQLQPAASPDSYPQYLAINTALLAMAAAERAGIDRRGRHRLGVAALTADIGMMRLDELDARRDHLDPDSRMLIEAHVSRGAEFLLRCGGRGYELAATVAFEHHLRPDGSGYPARRFASESHWASRLIAACLAVGALRVERPFRPAWTSTRVVGYLEEGAGTVFDGESARAVAALLRSGAA